MRTMRPTIPPPQLIITIPGPTPVVPIMIPNIPPPQLCTIPIPLSCPPMSAVASVIPPQHTLIPLPPAITSQPAQVAPQPAEIPTSISLDLDKYKREVGAVSTAASMHIASSDSLNVNTSEAAAAQYTDADVTPDDLSLSIVEEERTQGDTCEARNAEKMDDEDLSDGNENELTIDEKLDEVPLQHLPKKQRELFLRIQGLQKDSTPEAQQVHYFEKYLSLLLLTICVFYFTSYRIQKSNRTKKTGIRTRRTKKDRILLRNPQAPTATT